MKRVLSLIVLCTVAFFSAMADNPAYPTGKDINIVGHVTAGGEHLPYVTIAIEGTALGTTTDDTGHYFMKGLDPGKYTIIVSAVGYVPTQKTVEVIEGQTLEVNFDLQEDVIGINEVVVTADRNEVSRKDATVVVSAISPKMFEVAAAPALSEGIKFSTGIRVENNCQNCGFTQVRMNGLSGPYTQMLINSKPISSGLAGVYGLEQIPSNMIERVEVVRGGGSALYGGNAIAGTINIITKDPINNSFKVNTTYDMIGVGADGDDVAGESNIMFNGTIVADDQKSGLFVFGAKRDREHYDANNDGYSEIADLKNSSVGFQTFYKPTQLTKLTLEYHNINEYRRGGNDFDKKEHFASIAEMVDHKINSGSLQFDAFFNSDRETKLSTYIAAEHIDRDSYYGAGQDPNAYGATKNLTFNGGAHFSTKFDKFLFAPSTFMLGIDNTYGNLDDNKQIFEELNASNVLERVYKVSTIADQSINTFGSFIQNQWNMKHVKFLVGLRVDNYNIKNKETGDDKSNTVVIPRANVLIDVTHWMQMRLTYAKGYRAPQIFDEDLHIAANEARRIIHVNDPSLTEETSHSFSGSVDLNRTFGKWQTSLLIEGFYTLLDNPFINEYSDVVDGVMTSTRLNGPDAKVAGLNTEFKAAPSNKLSFQTGWTFQNSEYEKAYQWSEATEQYTDKMLRSPNVYGYFVTNVNITPKFRTAVTGNFTGPMYAPYLGEAGEKLVKTESFFDGGVRFFYDIKVSKSLKMQLNAGVSNVFNSFQDDFDRGENRDAGYTYGPTRPRTISFGLVIGNIL
ncbi:MAG: TonB-dependent receptor [Bacteroidales bacterium]|jgi:outer membrane receptor for ferrienterochelin and colicins|nr:TonB-dependent receptor [Bacteroidales bacterium]